jgi:polyhydroxybutyrate depolymerase
MLRILSCCALSGMMLVAACNDDDASDASVNPPGSSGCRSQTTRQPGASAISTLSWGGVERRFLVHLPLGYDPTHPHPVVLVFHGGLGTGEQVEESSGFSSIADRESFIAVYPNGIDRTWNGGNCCGSAQEQDVDDVGFVVAVLDQLEAELCIDTARVYATGISNGAILSQRLACELSDRIAAIGPIAGTLNVDECTPTRPVPLMEIHGTDDKHVPWEGGIGCGLTGVSFASVPSTIQGWRERNGCVSGPTALYVQEGDGRCEVQGACAENASVVLCTIEGGGHSWPGGTSSPQVPQLQACVQAGEGGQSTTFHASEQLWSFFRSHPMP